jgi:hypothetical protein
VWLPILAALAGPVVVAASYARQQKRADPAITQALVQAQQRSPKFVERGPLRWYHMLVVAAVLALPFAQWFAFLRFQTRVSFLVPLAIAVTLMLVVGAFYPRFVPAARPARTSLRESGLSTAIIGAALILAFVLPSSGMTTLLRGALADILALIGTGHLIRVLQQPKIESR